METFRENANKMSSGSSPLGVTFFTAVKPFDANIAISDNFVLIANNSVLYYNILDKLDYLTKHYQSPRQ